MAELRIQHLRIGGLITNYFCTSRCGHCLYNCGPKREKDFIKPETAEIMLKKVRSMGCTSVHIGGGEPMLKPMALLEVMESARNVGVGIDYVETNASWYIDENSAFDILKQLRNAGLHTLLVSISPFHNGSVPLAKTLGVMSACQKAGIQVFPWTREFLSDLSRLDASHSHSINEFEEIFGENYLSTVLQRYWIHLGGRALDTFRPILPPLTADEIRLKHARFCRTALSDTTHFQPCFSGEHNIPTIRTVEGTITSNWLLRFKWCNAQSQKSMD